MLRGGPWRVNLPSGHATIERDGIARFVLPRPRPPCAACLRRRCGRGLWDGLPFVSLDLAPRHAARRARALCTRASDRALVLVLSSRQAAAGCRCGIGVAAAIAVLYALAGILFLLLLALITPLCDVSQTAPAHDFP